MNHCSSAPDLTKDYLRLRMDLNSVNLHRGGYHMRDNYTGEPSFYRGSDEVAKRIGIPTQEALALLPQDARILSVEYTEGKIDAMVDKTSAQAIAQRLANLRSKNGQCFWEVLLGDAALPTRIEPEAAKPAPTGAEGGN